MDKEKYMIRVVNVVATTSLNKAVNLDQVARTFPQITTYQPEIYHCVYFKSPHMRGKVSLFASGKMISVGTKCVADAIGDLKYVAKLLEERNIARMIEEPRIHNIVVVIDVGKPLNIDEFIRRLPGAIYEPEIFPGLMYKYKNFTFLIFASGKIVCAGLRAERQIEDVKLIVRDLLNSC